MLKIHYEFLPLVKGFFIRQYVNETLLDYDHLFWFVRYDIILHVPNTLFLLNTFLESFRPFEVLYQYLGWAEIMLFQ